VAHEENMLMVELAVKLLREFKCSEFSLVNKLSEGVDGFEFRICFKGNSFASD
jgi:hypothetical protein